MGDKVKQLLAKPIQLAEQVVYEASCCKQECGDLTFKTEKLAALLRLVSRECSDLSESPTRRIVEVTEKVLCKALSLLRCRAIALLKRVFPTIPAAGFRKVSFRLQDSIDNVHWLLLIFSPADDLGGQNLPPIAANEPVLFLIWEQIVILCTGFPEDRSDVAASLVALAGRDGRYGKLIMEELLTLLKEGKMKGQENAVRAIGLLARDPEHIENMIQMGVCSVFAQILEEGPMKVQAAVTWAVSLFAANYPTCRDLLVQLNIVRLLMDHFAFLTLEEHSKHDIVNTKPTSMTSGNFSYETKANMQEITAKALWFLAKDNSPICHTIADSRALLCFAVLLEIGPKAVRYNCAMAVMEITAVAEKHADLRESAFDPNSPACKAIVRVMLKIIKKPHSEVLIPCIKTIGNLARTFKVATETRIIDPLLRLVDIEGKERVTMEALIALTKYACTENDLHMDHSKAIISAGGTKYLIRLLMYGFAGMRVRTHALVLLSYLALHVPHSEELARADVLKLLEWTSKGSSLGLDEVNQELLLESKSRLKLYQSSIPRRFHESHMPGDDMWDVNTIIDFMLS